MNILVNCTALSAAKAFVIAAALSASPAFPNGIIDNVNGITLDENGKVIRFSAILVDETGKVSKLITAKDKAPKRPNWRSDGRGLTMIPGLINAHGDVMDLGFQALTLDLSGTRSLTEAQSAISAYAAKNPSRRWILGHGWDQARWTVDKFPTASDLDLAVPDRPVWLVHADGGAGWANSAAMRQGEITPSTKMGAAGRIDKVAGKPSGIFAGRAMQLIEARVPSPRAKDRDIALLKAQELMLSHGITAAADIGTTIEDWQTYRRAGDIGRLNIRIFGYADGTQQMELIAGASPSPWLYADRLRLGGVAIDIDGALSSRSAWLSEPYADAPSQRGVRYDSYAELRNTMVRASMDEFQISLSAAGNSAVGEAVGAINDLSETFPGDRRWRIDNPAIVNAGHISALGENGVVTVLRPTAATQDREMAFKRLGDMRAATAFPARSIGRNGATVAFGSTGSLRPFIEIATAITREDANGQPFGGWRPEERLSRAQALAGFTLGAAKSAFAEAKVGTLIPGHRADFVLIDTDPLLATPSAIRQTKVMETWVAGRPVFNADAAKSGGSGDALTR